jgi:hypothetical protein
MQKLSRAESGQALKSAPIARKQVERDEGCMGINTLAYQIVQQSIGEEPKGKMANRGIARAKSLTAQERKDIAMKRLGTTKACVAVANKNARIIWSLIAHEEEYRHAA